MVHKHNISDLIAPKPIKTQPAHPLKTEPPNQHILWPPWVDCVTTISHLVSCVVMMMNMMMMEVMEVVVVVTRMWMIILSC